MIHPIQVDRVLLINTNIAVAHQEDLESRFKNEVSWEANNQLLLSVTFERDSFKCDDLTSLGV